MDITALSEDKFDPVDWINEHFQKYSEETKTTKKKDITADNENSVDFINSYVSKLQLYVQQVNYAVEDSSQQLVASMPRVVKDAKALHSDVKELQQRMLLMRQEVAAVQEETGECMATLERLNSLQTKLQTAKESLQESDGWGNLISELEDSFERNDLKSVCDKISALQKSLQAQEQLPGHSDRQSQVEDFKNRLEALASPNVVQSFAEGSVEQAQRYVSIFSAIQRQSQLLQYYRAVQKTTLQQQWKQTLELQATETTGQQQHFLTLFYDQLLENCQRQVKWCSKVFDSEDAVQQPFILLAELLPALQPSRDNHTLQLLKTCNERLELLQQFAQANHTFVLQLNAYLDQSSIQLTQELKQQLGLAIYEYFHKFIQQYPRLEETQLSTQVDRVLVTQPHAGDAVRYLKDMTSKLFSWLHESLTRCSNITSDLALCKLINFLGGIFKRLLEQFSKTQRQLTLNIGSTANTTSSDSSWSMLQYTLALLECLADFQQRLQKFEKTLQERLQTIEHKLKENQLTNINIYQTFDSSERQRILNSITEFQQKRLEANQDAVNSSLGIFSNIYDALKTHFTEKHDITLNILLQPLDSHLSEIQPPTQSSTYGQLQDMPAFSFAPQESITQIGQYLLTLPQHLEPLLLDPSSLLKQALEMCHIKYSQPIPSADILLSLVVAQCCVLYQSQILQIKLLSNSAAKQLSVDIEYLSSVVEELGLALNTSLTQILTLLKASPENYLSIGSGCEPRLVTAIRQMRNIIVTHNLIMADLTSQSGLRTKLGDIVEHSSTALNEATEVTKGLRNVVGWLKQASIEVREAGKRAVTQIQTSNPNFLAHEFDLDDPELLSPTAINAEDSAYDTKSLSSQDLTANTRHSLSQPQSPRARGRVDNFTAGYHRSTSIITQLEKSKILLKMSDQVDKPLCILHYNDVYNVDTTTEVEPIGGAARFCTAIKTFQKDDPLVLFSGDIFSPSMLSTFTQGEQMIPVLNDVGTHCAVFGNHDFDHGLDVLVELIKKTPFPWLMSNVVDNETGRPLGGGKISHFIFHNQISIGLIGLVEREWLETLPTIDPKEVTYIDYVEAGNKLAAELRNEGCELIIALTHMRTPNDINLAENCSGIDLILGGHDHVYEIREVNGINIIKSGTDFRQFSKITIQKDRDEKGRIKIDVEAINVTAKYAEDEKLKQELIKYSEVIEAKMTEVLGNFGVELDGRFSTIRTQETNLGDWVCDVVLAATGADVVIINSGTFRSDQIHPPGPFTMKDLVNIIPMRDPLVLLEISGKRLYEALENSVSSYPKLEGRFPQVSGVIFAFDPTKPPGQRIDSQLVQVGDEYLKIDHTYKICIKSYIYNGCDGFTMFKDAKVLMDDDSCPELGLTVQNHFKAINLRNGKGGHHTKHRQSLVTLSRRHSMVQMLDNLELDGPSPIRKLSVTHQTKSIDLTNTNCSKMLRRASLDDLEQASCQLAPKIQHRIIRIQNPEHYNQLLMKKETSIKNTTITEADDE